MPYLRPEAVLRRFSRFALSTVRPAVREDEVFVRGQVGSMASTLRFLAGELEGRERALEEQERALCEALDDVADTVGSNGPVAAAVVRARERLDGTAEGSDPRERERALLAAADDVLARIDETCDGAAAREARRPLYGFLDARLAAQHRLLGRRTDAEEDDGVEDEDGVGPEGEGKDGDEEAREHGERDGDGTGGDPGAGGEGS